MTENPLTKPPKSEDVPKPPHKRSATMSDIECLQCGETKAAVKAHQYICAIVGYDGECQYDWPKHRWADWNDKELNSLGVLPEHHDKYRRATADEIQFIDCTHQGREHTFPSNNDLPATLCTSCWTDTKKEETDDQG